VFDVVALESVVEVDGVLVVVVVEDLELSAD
jgi:hypothetical protein